MTSRPLACQTLDLSAAKLPRRLPRCHAPAAVAAFASAHEPVATLGACVQHAEVLASAGAADQAAICRGFDGARRQDRSLPCRSDSLMRFMCLAVDDHLRRRRRGRGDQGIHECHVLFLVSRGCRFHIVRPAEWRVWESNPHLGALWPKNPDSPAPPGSARAAAGSRAS